MAFVASDRAAACTWVSPGPMKSDDDLASCVDSPPTRQGGGGGGGDGDIGVARIEFAVTEGTTGLQSSTDSFLPAAVKSAITVRTSNALTMSEMRDHAGLFAEPSFVAESTELERTHTGRFALSRKGLGEGALTNSIEPKRTRVGLGIAMCRCPARRTRCGLEDVAERDAESMRCAAERCGGGVGKGEESC